MTNPCTILCALLTVLIVLTVWGQQGAYQSGYYAGRHLEIVDCTLTKNRMDLEMTR